MKDAAIKGELLVSQDSQTKGYIESTDASVVQRSSFVRLTDSYLRYFAGGSTHTARAKQLDIDHFSKFLAAFRGLAKIEKLKVQDWDFSATQRFVEDSLRHGESPATVARRLATLKHMGRTLAEKIPGYINPAREVRAPRLPTHKPQGLTPAEISKIRSKAAERLAHKRSFVRLRNLTILDFLLDTGIRADEIRQLRMSQLDDNLEWLKNVRTKGKRYRNVYITSAVRPKLKEYLKQRALEIERFIPKLSRKQDRMLPLFPSGYSASAADPESFLMGSKSIWRAIHELSVDTPLHPHLLRHSYALELLDDSNDVRLVAQALGHSDVRTTMRYTERTDSQIARALERTRSKQ